jgi:hypothetical protein
VYGCDPRDTAKYRALEKSGDVNDTDLVGKMANCAVS